jgi:plasmid stabilization system protein ParE
MKVVWTGKASSDVARLHEFLAEVNPRAAKAVVQRLIAAPRRLLSAPRCGEGLAQFAPREIRCIFVGDYALHYELADETIYILRVWHMLEDR